MREKFQMNEFWERNKKPSSADSFLSSFLPSSVPSSFVSVSFFQSSFFHSSFLLSFLLILAGSDDECVLAC